MLDINLIKQALRDHHHTVGQVIPTPGNAGRYEFVVDGQILSLSETRALLERDEAADPHANHVH